MNLQNWCGLGPLYSCSVIFTFLGGCASEGGGLSSRTGTSDVDGGPPLVNTAGPTAGEDGSQCEDVVSADLPPAPAELMMVADRSGSMRLGINVRFGRNPIDRLDPTSRWDAVKNSLNTLAPNLNKLGFELGLTSFPAPGRGNCDVDAEPQIDFGASPKEITDALEMYGPPSGQTPMLQAINAASNYLKTLPKSDIPRMIVLATDGSPNCGHSVTQVETAVGILHGMGVDTVVIGMTLFTTEDATEAAELDNLSLNKIADAGGRPRPGDLRYYDVKSVDELENSLRGIALTAAGCRFVLPELRESAELVGVLLDDQEVPDDQWERDGDTHVKLTGQACDDLSTGKFLAVRAEFQGCKPEEPAETVELL